ncbi:uncharacterized protein DUF2637 [Actinoallomurus bryophytorum]|uniref:Uncharacterized protein DUF2637 n=1 Tax=Actinoallomurus bryophytorum TaxID=1490222 RepID=A0A543CPE4_9ACTN|nr:DUF2637 domain-containing protein [Actinoallomurus bryophytorum]TQL98840.1 uncharacterized protein DUF2637 [Actinoallomurus bryophytorum]
MTYRDQDAERRGQPVRALGDSTGERAAVSLIGLAMLALALIGMYVSFQTVYAYVHPWFRDTAWAVPISIDVAILVFSAADLLLSYWRMAKPSMRLIPWGFTAATIWLNWQAGGPVPIRIAHAAMPALWVLFCEYARHVLAARVGLVNGARMEKVRRSRWLLAPVSTARLRRRMILWEITSYRRALELEAERRTEIARLEMAHGRRWRRHAPAPDRLALKLSAVAPAELLPSLTASLATVPAVPAVPAPVRAVPPPVAEPSDITRPDLPRVDPEMTGFAETAPEPKTASGGSARQRAAALLANEPDIPGTELARRLNVTTGYGRRLRSELLNTTTGYR